MPILYGLAQLLNAIIEEGNRPRTPCEDAANNSLALGLAGSLGDVIEAKRAARQASTSPRTRPSLP